MTVLKNWTEQSFGAIKVNRNMKPILPNLFCKMNVIPIYECWNTRSSGFVYILTFCFHFTGVPRIFTESDEQEISALVSHLSGEDDQFILDYIKNSRININIRQVYWSLDWLLTSWMIVSKFSFFTAPSGPFTGRNGLISGIWSRNGGSEGLECIKLVFKPSN